MELVGFELIKESETSLRKWEKNKVRESGIIVSSDENTITNKGDNVLVLDDKFLSRKNNYLETSLNLLKDCIDKPSFIVISEDLRTLDKVKRILSSYAIYNLDYVDMDRNDDMSFLLNRVNFASSSAVLIHASDSKFENKKVVNLMDRFINKVFIDSKAISNKVYMFVDCVTNLGKSQLLVKSISLRKPANLKYIFIADDIDCFNYDYPTYSKTIKDSCNSIIYYHSSDVGTLNELSRIANFERKVINKAVDERVVFDFKTINEDEIVYIQQDGLSRVTKIN